MPLMKGQSCKRLRSAPWTGMAHPILFGCLKKPRMYARPPPAAVSQKYVRNFFEDNGFRYLEGLRHLSDPGGTMECQLPTMEHVTYHRRDRFAATWCVVGKKASAADGPAVNPAITRRTNAQGG
jgi:hypothetical protein